MTGEDIFWTVVLGMLSIELCASAEWFAHKLLALTVHVAYPGNAKRAAARLKDWEADLDHVPGQSLKLLYVAAFLTLPFTLRRIGQLIESAWTGVREGRPLEWLARVLLSLSTLILRGDRDHLKEAWFGELAFIPSPRTRVRFALGLLYAAGVIAIERRKPRRSSR
jgi:hypothetical protein